MNAQPTGEPANILLASLDEVELIRLGDGIGLDTTGSHD